MGCGVSSEEGGGAHNPHSAGARESNRRAVHEPVVRFTEARCEEEQKTVVTKIVPGSFVGEGIRRIPAYETELNRDQLHDKRKAFWSIRGFRHDRVETKKVGRPERWELLKLICKSEPRMKRTKKMSRYRG